jgi:hypothetical protein
MTAKELKDRIVKEARAWVARHHPMALTTPGRCVYDAAAVIACAREHGVTLCVQAGSALWPHKRPEEDDGVSPSHFGYVWDPQAVGVVSRVQECRHALRNGGTAILPEIHVWAGDVRTQELVDLTTRYWPEQAMRVAQLEWTAPAPPDYLWHDEVDAGISYEPFEDASRLAYEFCRKIWDDANVGLRSTV